jgi:hypothetical protein
MQSERALRLLVEANLVREPAPVDFQHSPAHIEHGVCESREAAGQQEPEQRQRDGRDRPPVRDSRRSASAR